MEITISMRREKTILALIFGLIAFSTVFVLTGAAITLVYGFFHDHKAVEKPEFYINPLLQAELDVLYEKYPHIIQQDVNNVYTSTSETCYSEALQGMKDEKYGAFTQAITSELCQAVMAGLITDYLDMLGVPYYEGESGEPPILLTE